MILPCRGTPPHNPLHPAGAIFAVQSCELDADTSCSKAAVGVDTDSRFFDNVAWGGGGGAMFLVQVRGWLAQGIG